jgi:hypothetical protein
MANRKNMPKVFLGSSKESLPELKIVQALIGKQVRIKPWTDRSLWKAGHFVLESLLNQVPDFDFGVFIFGKDDVTVSRGVKRPSPRDNVVFEAGLFMSQIGRERTLVIAPEGGKVPIKILSDFAGLVLIPYSVPKDRADLRNALKPAATEVREQIAQLRQRPPGGPPPSPTVDKLHDVPDAFEEIKRLIEETVVQGGNAVVDNIALDMEITWPLLKSRIIENQSTKNVIWRSLMLDPNSNVIKKLASPTVDPKAARRQALEIKKKCDQFKSSLKRRKVKFQCRKYQTAPFIHGFLVNETELFVTLCHVDNKGKLIARPNPYFRFRKGSKSKAEENFFIVFNRWFDYHWRKEKRVWP